MNKLYYIIVMSATLFVGCQSSTIINGEALSHLTDSISMESDTTTIGAILTDSVNVN